MSAKHFFKGLSWLLALNLLIKPVWIFGIDRQVQNIVGHEAYGSYFALYNLTYILLFLADAGLSNMLTQRLAAQPNLDIRQLLKLKLGLLTLYALVCFGVASLADVSQGTILHLLIVTQSLTSLFVFLRSLLTAKQAFKTDAIFSVLDKTLLLLLCVGPVYGAFFHMTIVRFLQLQVISSSVAVIALALLLIKKAAFTSGEKSNIKTIGRWLAPFIFILLFMSAHNRLDAFLLERIHPNGAVQAGIYATAYRLLDATNMIGYLTASFLVPFLSRHRHDKGLLQQVVLASRHGLLLFAVSIAAFVAVFAPWIQQVLYHSDSAYSNTVTRLCLAALPGYAMIHIYGSLLTATGEFRSFILLLLLAVVVNVVLNVWLIPLYGAEGCCLAALVSQYTCGLLLWLFSSRKLAISYGAKSAVLYPAAAGLLGLLFVFSQRLTGNVWIILSSIAALALLVLFTQRSLLKKLFLPFYQ